MKRIVTLLILISMLFTQILCFADANVMLPQSIKVLAIGNDSISNSMEHLYEVLKAMGIQEVTLGVLKVSKSDLDDHALNGQENKTAYTYSKCSDATNGQWESLKPKQTMMNGLTDDNWNYIILSQDLAKGGIPSAYDPSLSQLINYIKSRKTYSKIAFEMPWSYQTNSREAGFETYGKDQVIMTSAILNAVENAAKINNKLNIMIPTGTAVQNLRTSFVGDTFMPVDANTNHTYGKYMLSLMIAKSITGGASVENVASTFIDAKVKDAIVESINNAYKNPYKVTNSGYKSSGVTTDFAAKINTGFVDVTDRGTYNEKTGVFTFTNNAVARHGVDVLYNPESAITLDGQKCAYIDGRFYAPQVLADVLDGKIEGKSAGKGTFDTSLDLIFDKQSNLKGTVKVSNFMTNYNKKITAEFTKPAELRAIGKFELDIKPNSDTTYEFAVNNFNTTQNTYSYALKLNVGDESYVYEGNKLFTFAKKAKGIKIDGIVSAGEWDENYVMICNDKSNATHLPSWGGPSDASAKIYAAWDKDNFYFCAEVTDDIFYNSEPANKLYNGDSIQIGVYKHTENNFIPAPFADLNYHEYTLGLVAGEAYVYKSRTQTSAAPKGEIVGTNLAIVNNVTKTVYEYCIPWKEMFGESYNAKSSDVLGFSVLYNDNDTLGRRGWIEFGSGIGGTKTTELFLQMFLTDQEVSDEISVYVNNKKLTFDQPPVLLNDRTLVPMRKIFEELGAEVTWDDATQTAKAQKDGITVEITIGNNVIKVDNQSITLDVPAQLINSRTLVPVRAVAEAFKNNVDWDDETQSVFID